MFIYSFDFNCINKEYIYIYTHCHFQTMSTIHVILKALSDFAQIPNTHYPNNFNNVKKKNQSIRYMYLKVFNKKV